jgi:hypothetical protein
MTIPGIRYVKVFRWMGEWMISRRSGKSHEAMSESIPICNDENIGRVS